MRRRPPRSTRTYTLFPYTTLCRSQGNLDWQADCECDVRPKPHAFIRNVLNPPTTDIGCPFHTGCAANGPDPQFTPAVRHRIVSMIMRRSEERRVGKEGVSTCSSRWSPYH